MSRRRLRPVLLLLALLTAAAAAEERLALPVADDWETLTWVNAPELWRADFLVRGAEGGQDLLSVERFSTVPPPDPLQFIQGYADNLSTLCTGARIYRTFTGEENGYQTVVRLMLCPQAPDAEDGEVTMIKAIRGEQGFYVIARTRRVPSFDLDSFPISQQDVAIWSRQLSGMTLCDSADAAHPCASGEAEDASAPDA